MSAITAKASRKMKKYALLTREPRCFLGSFAFSWEQRKLGELVDRVVRKNTNNESTLPLTISAQYGLVDQITYFNNRVASRDVSNYYLVLNGEFAYNKSTSDGYPFGAVKRLDLYEKGVLSTLYIVFAPKKEQQIDSDFLTVFFDTDRWHKGVAERAAEGARNHGLLNISAEDFFEIDLSVPKDIVEQKEIGAFIRQLDNLITLHQRKCAFLFKCFRTVISKKLVTSTLSWEQRKAKELFVSTADKGYPELPVLSATQDRGMIRRDENSINIFHDKKNEAGYKRVLPGQFVIHLRSFQGGFAHSAIEGITSPAYTVFGFSEPEKHDSEYWKYVFTSKSFIRRLETVTYGIRDGRSISYEEFLTLGFVYPSKAEQTAIARYLDKLSDLITLHQRECISFTGRAVRLFQAINKKQITSSWEQRKLTEFVESFSGLTYTPNDVQENGTLVLRSSNVSNGEVVDADNVYVNPQVVNSENVKVGDIVVVVRNGSRSLIGKHAQIKAFMPNTVIGAFMTGIRSECPEFTNALLNTSRFEEEIAMNMGATINQITGYMFSKMEFKVPCLDEQKKIGEYFEKLDRLVTLHQRKPFFMEWRTSDANRNQTNRLVL